MLNDLVRALRAVPGGGKFEEDYWTHIYCSVKEAPHKDWSNMPMQDYNHGGLGVEMKLKKVSCPSKATGTSIMHPAATRTVSFDPNQSAEECKNTVLEQFNKQIGDFRLRVQVKTPEGKHASIRWGVLLWRKDLTEFLYFEEEMCELNPEDYYAEFSDYIHRGNPSSNLWIYEKSTRIKRLSVTMPKKGAKVQPYFDVPAVGKGAYLFKVSPVSELPIWVPPGLHKKIMDASNGDAPSLLNSFFGQ